MPNFPPLPDFPRSTPSPKTKADNCCSRTERCCWTIATWLPISMVYGATLWAIYVSAYLIAISQIKGLQGRPHPLPNLIFPTLEAQAKCRIGWLIACLVVALYALCIWSYSVAVFTDPGSPIEVVLSPHTPTLTLPVSQPCTDLGLQDNGYSYLPQWQPTSTNPSLQSNLTVKNDGRARYCQKCNYMKPDRTHHCSICKRCILKMDHHCPWLGNCIGFRNYKPFVLFLIYLTLFCFVCTVEAAVTLWYWISYVTPVHTPPQLPLSLVEVEEKFANVENADYLPVQWILLAVIAGVVSLCVGGFSIWHIMYPTHQPPTPLRSS